MDLLRKVKPPNIHLISNRPGWKEKSIIMLLQFRVGSPQAPYPLHSIVSGQTRVHLLTSCKCLRYSLSLLKVSKFGSYLVALLQGDSWRSLGKTSLGWCWKVNVKWERDRNASRLCNVVGRIMTPHRYPGLVPGTVNMLLYRIKRKIWLSMLRWEYPELSRWA